MTSTQLEASHHMITEGIVATVVNQATMTETEEDTILFQKKLQKVLGMKFIASATRKDKNLRRLINFVEKRDWDAIKLSYSQHWFNVRNYLHVREDCLLIERTYRHSNTAASDSTGQPTYDTPRVGRHDGLMPKCVVSTHPSLDRPEDAKLRAFQGKIFKPIIGKAFIPNGFGRRSI